MYGLAEINHINKVGSPHEASIAAQALTSRKTLEEKATNRRVSLLASAIKRLAEDGKVAVLVVGD